MSSVNRLTRPDLAAIAVQSPVLPTEVQQQHRSVFSRQASSSRHPSCHLVDSPGMPSGYQASSSLPHGALNDLPLSMKHFICLCSTSSTPASEKDLRRQLLLLRDHCVGLSNKIKEKELLSQGGKHISHRVEATADFNSCLVIIFTASLVFADEMEDIARDSLSSIVEKLKAAQESGDERVFRAAVVEVVNRILLCTPLEPPAFDLVSLSTTARTSEQSLRKSGEWEPTLKDECLDFLVVEDGVPLLLEYAWMRWLRFFEEGYARYMESLSTEQQRGARAATAVEPVTFADDEDVEESVQRGHIAPTPGAWPTAAMPRFAPRQTHWKSRTSAYAQFSCLLLAIFFVRTKEFSLNYLARVTKLVQYYEYQLQYEDGRPITVKEGVDNGTVHYKLRDRDNARSSAGTPRKLPKEEEVEEREVAAAPAFLSTPGYDSCATLHTCTSRPASVMQESAPVQPHRRRHTCFFTEELPEEVQPSTRKLNDDQGEGGDTRRSQEASSAIPVRYIEGIDLPSLWAGCEGECVQLDDGGFELNGAA